MVAPSMERPMPAMASPVCVFLILGSGKWLHTSRYLDDPMVNVCFLNLGLVCVCGILEGVTLGPRKELAPLTILPLGCAVYPRVRPTGRLLGHLD